MPQYLKTIMKYGVWQKVCYPCSSISETLPSIFSPNLTTTHCSTNKRNNYSRIVSARSILYILFYWFSNQISKQEIKTAPNTTIVMVLSVYREKILCTYKCLFKKFSFCCVKRNFRNEWGVSGIPLNVTVMGNAKINHWEIDLIHKRNNRYIRQC